MVLATIAVLSPWDGFCGLEGGEGNDDRKGSGADEWGEFVRTGRWFVKKEF